MNYENFYDIMMNESSEEKKKIDKINEKIEMDERRRLIVDLHFRIMQEEKQKKKELEIKQRKEIEQKKQIEKLKIQLLKDCARTFNVMTKELDANKTSRVGFENGIFPKMYDKCTQDKLVKFIDHNVGISEKSEIKLYDIYGYKYVWPKQIEICIEEICDNVDTECSDLISYCPVTCDCYKYKWENYGNEGYKFFYKTKK